MSWEVRQGDAVEQMRAMEEASVDAIVTDPPYGLEFMGKEWDAPHKARIRERVDMRTNPKEGKSTTHTPESYTAGRSFQAWAETWAREALRVLKPGGHLLAFGGTRTYHRLTCAIEDAGFEIRDCLAWLYGSGFPKSLDVSKQIDKAAGATREVIGAHPWASNAGADGGNAVFGAQTHALTLTAPATDEAARWQGWGTALKPAHEPIVLARKPLVGTVVVNVQAFGTGSLNVDGCRVAHDEECKPMRAQTSRESMTGEGKVRQGGRHEATTELKPAGRWPANVLLDEEAARMLDLQSGEMPITGRPNCAGRSYGDGERQVFGADKPRPYRGGFLDTGGASRFFYTSKADSGERHYAGRNTHPTVKPIDLMRWLCRLVTPKGGLVLDPFCGSGSTGVAALSEGFRFIGIEREAEYVEIARRRIAGPLFAEGR